MTEVQALCSICRALPPLDDFNGVLEHHSIQTLEESVKKGCPLCKVIWNTLLGVDSFESIRKKKDGEAAEAVVGLEYGPSHLPREICQYIWVSPDCSRNGGSKMTLFVREGK